MSYADRLKRLYEYERANNDHASSDEEKPEEE